jgi:hypothetical protein
MSNGGANIDSDVLSVTLPRCSKKLVRSVRKSLAKSVISPEEPQISGLPSAKQVENLQRPARQGR